MYVPDDKFRCRRAHNNKKQAAAVASVFKDLRMTRVRRMIHLGKVQNMFWANYPHMEKLSKPYSYRNDKVLLSLISVTNYDWVCSICTSHVKNLMMTSSNKSVSKNYGGLILSE